MIRNAAGLLCAGFLLLVTTLVGASGSEEPAVAQAASGGTSTVPPSVDADAVYELGKTLFDQYAPEEVKRDYEFPSREQWNGFLPRLQKALEGDSLEDLAVLEPDARAALKIIDYWPEGAELGAWLRERLELIEAARDIVKARPVKQPEQPVATGPVIPAYEFWLARIKATRVPSASHSVIGSFRRGFTAERVPPELAWLAEVESMFEANARSPAGAKGYFQLMPDTARSLGLSTVLPDDRTDADKSSRAAARLLRTLHGKFQDWPLALAAYNAGEGRVRRTLQKRGATSFAAIAEALPVETRLYVPKVLATIEVRTGMKPAGLGPPGLR